MTMTIKKKLAKGIMTLASLEANLQPLKYRKFSVVQPRQLYCCENENTIFTNVRWSFCINLGQSPKQLGVSEFFIFYNWLRINC